MEQKVMRYYNTELKAKDGTEDMIVEGYALKFNKETQIGSGEWGWIEKIDEKALDETDMSNVIFNYNHSWDLVEARTSNKSLSLEVDEIGLKIVAKLSDTSSGVDLYKRIKSGLINRMSFAAVITGNVWEESKDSKLDRRTITKFGTILDVSAVTFPAYEDTSISARSGYDVVDDQVKKHFKTKEVEERTEDRLSYSKQIEKLNKITGGIKK